MQGNRHKKLCKTYHTIAPIDLQLQASDLRDFTACCMEIFMQELSAGPTL